MSVPRRGRPVKAAPEETGRRIDKESWVPAYAQLAGILRDRISDETYSPGSRLPSEASLAKSFGVSPMTARQAVTVLAEEGLVRREQGSGTYVRRLQPLRTHFTLDALHAALGERERLEVKVRKASVEKAGGRVQEALEVTPGAPLVAVERLIRHGGEPLALQVAFTRFDPESPILEKMLNTDVLTEFFFEENGPGFKKGTVELVPTTLSSAEGGLLGEEPGASAFRLEQLFYDFSDRPAAFGWFLIAARRMRLVTRVGVWNG